MIKLIKVLTLLIIFLGVFNSCDFLPDGEIFKEIESPSIEGMSIDLNNISATTIELKEKTTFSYSIETGGKQLIESKGFLDNSTIWASTFLSTQFDLDPEKLTTGSHVLRIAFYTKSETGSLADKLDQEYLVVWKELRIEVDHTIPNNAVAITSIENKDHTIVITWKPYTKFNFQYHSCPVDWI